MKDKFEIQGKKYFFEDGYISKKMLTDITQLLLETQLYNPDDLNLLLPEEDTIDDCLFDVENNKEIFNLIINTRTNLIFKKTVGYATLTKEHKNDYLYGDISCLIHGDYQGIGLGGILLKKLIHIAKTKLKYDYLLATVNKKNKASSALIHKNIDLKDMEIFYNLYDVVYKINL